MKVKHSPGANKRRFGHLAAKFLEKTEHQALQGINPGGIYQAIWCRDASYILMDWFLSGNIHGTLQQIYPIWSQQITSSSREKIVYGRGSIDMKFLSEIYNDKKGKFKGALPTTIYQAGFSEVYGQNPDIDSTALMISTSSWILARSLIDREDIVKKPSSKLATKSIMASEHSSDYVSRLLLKVGITDPLKVIDFVLPCMLRAVEYLMRRDLDNDDILEQNHNEDWMDTILRAGKIVYSQACWILALSNLSTLLLMLRRKNKLDSIIRLKDKAVDAV